MKKLRWTKIAWILFGLFFLIQGFLKKNFIPVDDFARQFSNLLAWASLFLMLSAFVVIAFITSRRRHPSSEQGKWLDTAQFFYSKYFSFEQQIQTAMWSGVLSFLLSVVFGFGEIATFFVGFCIIISALEIFVYPAIPLKILAKQTEKTDGRKTGEEPKSEKAEVT